MLIVFGGLPGTGKTTVAKALSARLRAAYVRVDAIEHALRRGETGSEVGTAGYAVAFAIARSNLEIGNIVVADSVNPVPESRAAWREIAVAAGNGACLEVELVCTDPEEHRQRVEGRTADIDGFALPTWPSVVSHHYAAWEGDRLVIDTAVIAVIDAVTTIESVLKTRDML